MPLTPELALLSINELLKNDSKNNSLQEIIINHFRVSLSHTVTSLFQFNNDFKLKDVWSNINRSICCFYIEKIICDFASSFIFNDIQCIVDLSSIEIRLKYFIQFYEK